MIKRFIKRIPKEYKQDILDQILKENLMRMSLVSALMIVLETVIFLFFWDDVMEARIVAGIYICFNLAILPVMILVQKKNAGQTARRIAGTLYILASMVFCCLLSLFPQQQQVATINTYIMATFGIAAFLYTPPFECIAVYASVYLFFFIALPHYQKEAEIVHIFRINAFVMNAIAFVASRVVYRMRIASYIDKKEIEQKNSLLNDLAYRDSMTRLYNHESAYEKLCDEIQRSKRIRYPLTIMMLDIDNFKNINDRYGHLAGDRVIVSIAHILRRTCRITDILCRYGGDEYFIIMPDTSRDNALSLADRIMQNIRVVQFEHGLRVTLSGGISEYRGDAQTAEELMKSADLRLYQAKALGKNRFEIVEDRNIVQTSLFSF